MFVWVIAGSLVVAAPALKDERKPARPPAGRWTPVRVEHGGVDLPDRGHRGSVVWQFTPDSLRISSPPLLESTARAKYFDRGGTLEADFGDDGQVKSAIWRVNGDTLTICFGLPGGDRPTDFSSAKGTGRTLYVLTRRVSD